MNSEPNVVPTYPQTLLGGNPLRNPYKRRGSYMKNPVAWAILAHFARLDDDCTSVTVDSLEADMANQEKPRPQIIRILKQLDEDGWGTFKTGRKGHLSRFESP